MLPRRERLWPRSIVTTRRTSCFVSASDCLEEQSAVRLRADVGGGVGGRDLHGASDNSVEKWAIPQYPGNITSHEGRGLGEDDR